MGSQANVTTLRNSNIFNFNRFNFHEFIFTYNFSKLFASFFEQNKLFLPHLKFFLVENKVFLTFFIFFRTAKVTEILKNKDSVVENYEDFQLSKLFKTFKLFKKNLIIYRVINLNVFLKKCKKKIFILYEFFKKEGQLFFPRRFSFFLDFLQLTVLFIQHKISITFFIKIIAEVFRVLSKKIHNKFFSFITHYFNKLVFDSSLFFQKNKQNLNGIKFLISGKLRGRPRSKHFLKTFGSVPIQTQKASVECAKTHVFTLYGVFGIKMWICKN